MLAITLRSASKYAVNGLNVENAVSASTRSVEPDDDAADAAAGAPAAAPAAARPRQRAAAIIAVRDRSDPGRRPGRRPRWRDLGAFMYGLLRGRTTYSGGAPIKRARRAE